MSDRSLMVKLKASIFCLPLSDSALLRHYHQLKYFSLPGHASWPYDRQQNQPSYSQDSLDIGCEHATLAATAIEHLSSCMNRSHQNGK
jgi:hypothetical protein